MMLILTGQVGYIPAAYLEIIGDAPPIQEYEDVATAETNFETSYEASVEETNVVSTTIHLLISYHFMSFERYMYAS